MTTILTGTVSAGPLYEWFERDRNNRARLRAAGYTDGRITNWKSRGLPRAEVGNIAQFMGMTYEEYVHAAEAWQLRAKKLLRVAVLAAFTILTGLSGAFNITPTAHAASARADYTLARILEMLRRAKSWIKSLFRPTSDYAIA